MNQLTVFDIVELQTRSLIDCRNAQEWHYCHIEDSHWIPMNEIGNRLEEIKNMPEPRVVMCHHGIRSMHVVQFLQQHGIEAFNMQGGIDQWAVQIDAGIKRY